MASILKPFQLLSPKIQVPVGTLAIDWTHPLANGLIGAFVPGVSVGIDLTGNIGDLTIDTGAVIGASVEGPGLTSGAVSNPGMFRSSNLPASLTSYTALTLYYRAFNFGTLSGFADMFGIEYNNTNTTPFQIATIGLDGTGTRILAQWNSGGSFTTTTNGAGAAPTAGLASYGATFPVGGTVNLYINGTVAAGVSVAFGASGPTSSATSSLVIQDSLGNPTRTVNSTCFCGYIWNRILSSDEMLWIHLEPYSFLVPAEAEMSAMLLPPVLPLMGQIWI